LVIYTDSHLVLSEVSGFGGSFINNPNCT